MQKLNLPADIQALIVTNTYNLLYLSGFKGLSETEREAILIVTPSKKTLITAKLYQAEANKLKSKTLEVKIASERDQILKYISQSLKEVQKVGFEKNNLTVGEYEKYKDILPGKDLIATENIVENLREIKTKEEIAKIEKAQIISQKAFEKLLPTIKVGQTEKEIAHRLETIISSLGGSGLAFPTIVASGPNAGIPHHPTGNRKIKKGDTLLFDFGAKYENYCADLSRTIFVGKATSRQKQIYNHVAKAQKEAIEKIQKEIKLKDAYDFANNIFKSVKLQDYFIHGLGHGIGLEVHEAPHIRRTSDGLFENGMVFSVEPGLYFPWGGVRIEDLVAIVDGKPKVLGKMSNLQVI